MKKISGPSKDHRATGKTYIIVFSGIYSVDFLSAEDMKRMN